MNEPLLTIPEVATILRLTPSAIRRMVQERRLEHLKIGRLVRFSRPYIDSYMAQSVRPVKPAKASDVKLQR